MNNTRGKQHIEVVKELTRTTKDYRKLCNILSIEYHVDTAHIFASVEIPKAISEAEYERWVRLRREMYSSIGFPSTTVIFSLMNLAMMQETLEGITLKTMLVDKNVEIGKEPTFSELESTVITLKQVVESAEFCESLAHDVSCKVAEHEENAELYRVMLEAYHRYVFAEVCDERYDEDASVAHWVRQDEEMGTVLSRTTTIFPNS